MVRNKIKSFDKNNKATSKKIFWYKKEVNDNLIMNLENKKNENKKEQISKLSPLVFNETDWIFVTPSINFDLGKDECKVTEMTELGFWGWNYYTPCLVPSLWNSNKWFWLNDFFKYIDSVENNTKNIQLIKTILSIYCNNFIEFREFYHDKIDTSLIDFSKVHPLNLCEKFDLKDIRNWLAHDVLFERDKNWKVWIHIKVEQRDKRTNELIHKEAFIEPSFFEDTLKLSSSCSNLEIDTIYTSVNWWMNYYTFKYLWHICSGKPYKILWTHPKLDDLLKFGCLLPNYFKRRLKSKLEIVNMKELLKSQWLEFSPDNMWLVSMINRPYVHNLFSLLTINIYYLMLKNPGMSLSVIKNKFGKQILESFNIFDGDNNHYVNYFFENIENWMKVEALKTYFVTVYKDKWWKKWFYSSFKRRTTMKEELKRDSTNWSNFKDYKDELRHIRNAFAHWRYLVVWNCIKMWDIDDGSTWWSTLDNKYVNKNNSTKEWVYNIDDLYKRMLVNELRFEDMDDKNMLYCTNIICKNLLK